MVKEQRISNVLTAEGVILKVKFIVITALVFISACSFSPALPIATPTSESSTSQSASPTSSSCQPTDQDQYVYNSGRLQVQEPCITVMGTIDFMRSEPDGDFHIGLKLDPQYANLVNDCNSTCANGAEHGDLVVEPVCVLNVTQSDAISTCAKDPNPLTSLPNVGDHVWMQGRYVLDTSHGWMELHPLYRWEAA